jgi:hypothetical protein
MTKWLWRDCDALFSEWLILPAIALVYMTCRQGLRQFNESWAKWLPGSYFLS